MPKSATNATLLRRLIKEAHPMTLAIAVAVLQEKAEYLRTLTRGDGLMTQVAYNTIGEEMLRLLTD